MLIRINVYFSDSINSFIVLLQSSRFLTVVLFPSKKLVFYTHSLRPFDPSFLLHPSRYKFDHLSDLFVTPRPVRFKMSFYIIHSVELLSTYRAFVFTSRIISRVLLEMTTAVAQLCNRCTADLAPEK